MTIHEAIPAGYGKADWKDYTDYWREKDAEWIQSRIILRTENDTTRDALAQEVGALVYNLDKDQVELRSKAGPSITYKTLTPLPNTLETQEVAGPPQKTRIGHTAAADTGIVFSAAEIEITDDFRVLGGVLYVDPTGVFFKTGTKTARLNTSDTSLVSDSPVSAPGVTITAPGTLAATGRSGVIGALTVETNATVSGVLTAGANSSIAGVTFAANRVTASDGFNAQSGSFFGDGSGAQMRHSNRNGPFVQTTTGAVNIGGGGYTDVYNQMRIIGASGATAYITHYYSGKAIAPSFYQSSPTPDVNLYPEGTIWIS